jgi:hypothetical protein
VRGGAVEGEVSRGDLDGFWRDGGDLEDLAPKTMGFIVIDFFARGALKVVGFGEKFGFVPEIGVHTRAFPIK